VGPRGVPLMVLLAVMAAGLLAGIVWLWPILARRGVAFVGLRIALLVAVQVSMLGAVFVFVNRAYEFYASWSDLLGTNHTVASVVAVQPRSTGAGGTAGTTGARAAARMSPMVTLASSPVVVPGPRHGYGGRLEEVRFAGPLSGIKTTGYLYLPPGYSARSRPLPVIVVITRPAGSGAASYSAPRVAATAAAQIRAGRMAPAIIVMLPPSAGGRADQGCLDSPGGPQAGTFFSQDLPVALTGAYRAVPGPSGWAVLGGAGGGYCALQLATAPSGQFSAAAAAPGTYTVPPGIGETAGSPGLRRQDNLLWRLRHWPPPPIQVLFAGPGYQPGFASLARPPMTVATTRTAAGPSTLPVVLDWIGHALAARS
jgi:hypothetical protein